MPTISPHILDYCEGCKTEMVRCISCNNNCCNGGYGEIYGKECPHCIEAYNHQDMYWKDISSVVFTGTKKANKNE